MTSSDPTSDLDPDRTSRDPEIQKVIDRHLNRWPTTDPDRSE